MRAQWTALLLRRTVSSSASCPTWAAPGWRRHAASRRPRKPWQRWELRAPSPSPSFSTCQTFLKDVSGQMSTHTHVWTHTLQAVHTVHTHTCMDTHITGSTHCTHTHVWTHTLQAVHTAHTHTHVWIHTLQAVHTHTHTHVWIHTLQAVHTALYTHTRMDTHITGSTHCTHWTLRSPGLD